MVNYSKRKAGSAMSHNNAKLIRERERERDARRKSFPEKSLVDSMGPTHLLVLLGDLRDVSLRRFHWESLIRKVLLKVLIDLNRSY